MSSARTGTAASAAAVGVGRAMVGGEVDERRVGLVADAGDHRDAARGDGAHHDLLVEAPEVLDGAAAAGDDQQIGARNGPLGGKRVEALDRVGDFGGGGFALRRAPARR